MPPPLGLTAPGRNGSVNGTTPSAPQVRLSAAETRALRDAVAETRADASAAFRSSGDYATPPARGRDGVYRTADGTALVLLQLSRSPSTLGPGGMRAFISPSTNQVYISQLGGFAGETTKGPFNLESTSFPRGRYSAAKIQAMQEVAGSLRGARAPNRPELEQPRPQPRRDVDDDQDFSGDYSRSGGIFAEINRRSGGNI